MATTVKKTATEAAVEVKTRKPREIKDRYIVTRPHPKFDGLHQSFTGTGWVLLEKSPGWELNAASIDIKTTTIVVACIGGDEGVKVMKAPTGKSSGIISDILNGIDLVGGAVGTVESVIDAASKLDTESSATCTTEG